MFFLAAAVMSALLAQAPPPQMSPPPRQSAGDRALAAADFDTAYAAYQTAYAANAQDENAALGLGTIALYRNDLATAETYLGKAVALAPGNRLARRRLDTVTDREASQTNLTTQTVSVPFIITDPLPLVHATVDGKTLTFLLDTGAAGVAVAPDVTKQLGLKLNVVGEGMFAGGKRAKIYGTTLPSFAVGAAKMTHVDADVLPGDSLVMGGHRVDGVLGTAFLSHFIATIDYKRGQLVLYPRSAAASVIASAKAAGSAIEPMWLVADHFIFARAQVGDQPDALFNIDTGGGGMGVQLTKAQLDASHISIDPSKATTFTGGGGDAKVIPFKAPSIAVGPITKTNVPGLFFPDGDQYGIFPFNVAGTLSHEFFKGGAVTFDFVDMKLIVST